MAQTVGTNATSHVHCWGESYTYDAWANLLSIGVSSTAYNGCLHSEGFNQTMDSNNRIDPSDGFSYDAAGNLTGITSGGSYTYDAENHLVATAGVAYTYDGDGERIEKSSGEMYWYTSGGEVLDETDLSGNLTSEYIFFGGARIARRDGSGNLFYYLADHLGSSREIIEAGQSTACYDADFYPFGGERAYVNTCQQNYKFTGKERDPESGLDDFEARFYGSWTGRFTSPDDPFVGWNLADPQSLNLYAYVQDNPINDVDPTGHMGQCQIRDGGSTTSCGFDSEESAGLANILIEGVDSGISGGILTPGPDTEGMKANTAIQAAAQHNDTQNQAPQGQNSGSNATPPPPSTPQPASLAVVGIQVFNTGAAVGIMVEVTYQILDQNGKPFTGGGQKMEPQEEGISTYQDSKSSEKGTLPWTDIGPSRVPGTSKYADANGQFKDGPLGAVGNPGFHWTWNQDIRIRMGNKNINVRSQRITATSNSAGHGRISNGGDINAEH